MGKNRAYSIENLLPRSSTWLSGKACFVQTHDLYNVLRPLKCPLQSCWQGYDITYRYRKRVFFCIAVALCAVQWSKSVHPLRVHTLSCDFYP